jgi:hypothetical protein
MLATELRDLSLVSGERGLDQGGQMLAADQTHKKKEFR